MKLHNPTHPIKRNRDQTNPWNGRMEDYDPGSCISVLKRPADKDYRLPSAQVQRRLQGPRAKSKFL